MTRTQSPIRTRTTRTTTAVALVSALTAVLFVLPAPALADHAGWSVGAGFQIGGAHFRLVFGAHDGHRPGYYYRTSSRIRYGGHRCSSLCFRDGRHGYHHSSCPLVDAHLSHHRIHPVLLFDRFAPPPVWRGHHYRIVSPYRHHDRYDRYGDRHERRHDRYDRRYDRRHHRRGHHDRDHWRDRRHHDRRDRYDHDRRHNHRPGRGHDRGPG